MRAEAEFARVDTPDPLFLRAATPKFVPRVDHPRVERPVVARSGEIFEDVYEQNFSDLVHLAGMISGSVAIAEDVVQDAFARLYVRFENIENPAAYLRRSVLNGCVSRFRKHRRERLVGEHEDEPEANAEPSDRMDLEAVWPRSPTANALSWCSASTGSCPKPRSPRC